jgi:hypothetical protein
VASGSPLDHGEVLELLSQPVDPEGVDPSKSSPCTHHDALDVEGLSNTFKLSEGAPE